MDDWKTSFLLGLPIFSGYVKFLGCTTFPFLISPMFSLTFQHPRWCSTRSTEGFVQRSGKCGQSSCTRPLGSTGRSFGRWVLGVGPCLDVGQLEGSCVVCKKHALICLSLDSGDLRESVSWFAFIWFICVCFCCVCFAVAKSNSATSSTYIIIMFYCFSTERFWTHVFYPSSMLTRVFLSVFVCSFKMAWTSACHCSAGKDEGWQKKKEVQDDEEEDAWQNPCSWTVFHVNLQVR